MHRPAKTMPSSFASSLKTFYWNARAALRSKDRERIRRFCLHYLGFTQHQPIDESTKRAVAVIKDEFVDLVIDVGANVGQYGLSLRKAGYRKRIVSFEPLPNAHEELTRVASGDADWQVFARCALGSHRGSAEMNVSANSYSSSLLGMTKTHIDAAPDSSYVGTVRTDVLPLDAIRTGLVNVGNRVFLKIDTQGYELEVLRGADKLLEQVQAVQVELSLCPLYEGQPLYREVLDYLEAKGFEIWCVLPGFEDKQTLRTLQIEVVARRCR
jgi:FkbM family methyltransferase